ncbi:unnamed protein product [Pseudo-nitzschia multistriata]|uniref:Uncharacterized protein n=1 Tax=Pseudo-nitzschia multistriata TaxID=183589 RepID=A0A448ZNF1_9STRA|nr:unnamed protein product [Pseudo-nitzschia multistriata]
MPTKDNSSNSIHCEETTRGKTEKGSDKEDADPSLPLIHRRTALFNMAAAVVAASAGSATIPPLPSHAYTPDPDKLQESLYFVSRVQEATVQQERYIRKNLGGTGNGKEVRAKLKLTLRLVDKNYKLLDQINYASAYVTPPDQLVEASAAGYEAVDALQGAIDFVANDSNWAGGNDADRAEVLTGFLRDCREQLLVFTESMPAEKLRNARYRVEDENVKNRDEFDGDEDAGVYNPVNLPWKPVLAPTMPR